jgi:predicted dehydrogenase
MTPNRSINRKSLVTLLSILVLGISSMPVCSRADTQETARFRLAIVGLVHSHAWGHLRNIVKMATVELVAIAEPVVDLRDLAAKQAPGVSMYEDYRKMLDEKKPEAVWSFVENDRHLEITRECATRGIHVIFEKPMAANLAQSRDMLALAQKHKIKLMVNYQMAWWPENYTAHSLAEAGDLGKVWRVRAIIGHGGPASTNPNDVAGKNFWAWLNDEKRGGGALMDFSCYGAVWLRWYLGMPKSVYAVTTHTRPDVYRTNTNATVLATFAKNGIGIIEGSWDLPRSFQDVEVFGDKGSIFMAQRRIELTSGRTRKDVPPGTLPEDRSDPVSYFISCVRGGKPIEGMVSPEFNVDVMHIVGAAAQSAASGKPVILK